MRDEFINTIFVNIPFLIKFKLEVMRMDLFALSFIGILPLLLAIGVAVFILYYLPIFAKDAKKLTNATEEMNQTMKRISEQNEEMISLLKKLK